MFPAQWSDAAVTWVFVRGMEGEVNLSDYSVFFRRLIAPAIQLIRNNPLWEWRGWAPRGKKLRAAVFIMFALMFIYPDVFIEWVIFHHSEVLQHCPTRPCYFYVISYLWRLTRRVVTAVCTSCGVISTTPIFLFCFLFYFDVFHHTKIYLIFYFTK